MKPKTWANLIQAAALGPIVIACGFTIHWPILSAIQIILGCLIIIMAIALTISDCLKERKNNRLPPYLK